MEDIDRLDIRILELLQDNAALANAEIADRVGLSPNACWRRTRRLEERLETSLPEAIFVTSSGVPPADRSALFRRRAQPGQRPIFDRSGPVHPISGGSWAKAS